MRANCSNERGATALHVLRAGSYWYRDMLIPLGTHGASNGALISCHVVELRGGNRAACQVVVASGDQYSPVP